VIVQVVELTARALRACSSPRLKNSSALEFVSNAVVRGGVSVLAVVSVSLLGCGPPSEIGDAGPATIDRDAFVEPRCHEPSSLALALIEEPFAAGFAEELHGAGAGAWAALRAPDAPPGDILYLEAYAAGVAAQGGRVLVESLESWVTCDVCVFLGRGCPAYALEGDADAPLAPTPCEHLFLLHRGQVRVERLDDGGLDARVTTLDGDAAVQLVEVGRTGDPIAPEGFGQPIAGGACVEIDAVDVAATW
jgi:hypothetical protein